MNVLLVGPLYFNTPYRGLLVLVVLVIQSSLRSVVWWDGITVEVNILVAPGESVPPIDTAAPAFILTLL